MVKVRVLPRTEYWSCPCRGTVFCVDCRCGTLPACAKVTWLGASDCRVRHEDQTVTTCEQPDCPCWTGNQCPSANISIRLYQLWCERAKRYIEWTATEQERLHGANIPVGDLRVWIELYNQLKALGCDLYEYEQYVARFEHAVSRTPKEDDEDEASDEESGHVVQANS